MLLLFSLQRSLGHKVVLLLCRGDTARLQSLRGSMIVEVIL